MNKKKNNILKAAIAFAIALALLLPGSVAFADNENVESNCVNDEYQATVGIPIKLTPRRDASVSQISYAKPLSNSIPVTDNNFLSTSGTDILVWNDIWNDGDDCQNASVVTNGVGNVLVLTEIVKDIDQTALWGRWSTDCGETWSEVVTGWDEVGPDGVDSVSRPKLDFYEDNWAYGTCTAGGEYDAVAYYFEFPDITDPESGSQWVYRYIDWGTDDFSNFDSADVACYPYDAGTSPSPNFWGCIAITGDEPIWIEDAEDNTMIFLFSLGTGEARLVSFYNMDKDFDKMTCDIDKSIGQFYMTMEYVSETNPADAGTVFVKAPQFIPNDDWHEGGYPGFTFADVYNQNIVADGGSVYIIGETIVDGHTDIACLYSSNAGSSFSSSAVTSTDDDEVFPSITVAGDKVICTYIRDGDLFVAVSDDGAVTWEETSERVNDPEGTVVEQYSSSSMDGLCLAWTDNRNGPFEIYFDAVNVSIPFLEIESISGGIGVSAVITNNGTADATDVEWSITVTGGILGRIDKEFNGTIPILAVDAEETVKSGIFLGIGKIAVTVAAECAEVSSDEKVADGKQIIIFTIIN